MAYTTKNIIALVLLGLFVFIGLGMACVIQRDTLIDWWMPAAVCLLPAALLAFLYIRPLGRLTGISRPWMAACAAFALFFSVMLCSLYALNYYKSDHDTALACQATVTSKFTGERHRTKRVGRNRYVQGEPYTVYFIKMELPGGRVKELELTAGQYNNIRRGQKIDIEIEKGCLGVPVIKNMSLPKSKARKKSPRKHVKPNL